MRLNSIFAVLAAISNSKQQPEHGSSLQEIFSVSIKDPTENLLLGIEGGNEYYVQFTHDADSGTENSLILE
jgi:hypothetical protein